MNATFTAADAAIRHLAPAQGLTTALGSLLRWLLPSQARPVLVRKVARGQTLVIERPQGQRVVCVKGTLWVTQDNDDSDYVLEMSRSFITTRNDRVLVHALDDAWVRVGPRPGLKSSQRAWATALAASRD